MIILSNSLRKEGFPVPALPKRGNSIWIHSIDLSRANQAFLSAFKFQLSLILKRKFILSHVKLCQIRIWVVLQHIQAMSIAGALQLLLTTRASQLGQGGPTKHITWSIELDKSNVRPTCCSRLGARTSTLRLKPKYPAGNGPACLERESPKSNLLHTLPTLRFETVLNYVLSIEVFSSQQSLTKNRLSELPLHISAACLWAGMQSTWIALEGALPEMRYNRR